VISPTLSVRSRPAGHDSEPVRFTEQAERLGELAGLVSSQHNHSTQERVFIYALSHSRQGTRKAQVRNGLDPESGADNLIQHISSCDARGTT